MTSGGNVLTYGVYVIVYIIRRAGKNYIGLEVILTCPNLIIIMRS